MRGLPGSGKSTHSYELARETGAVRFCLDDLRSQVGEYSNFSKDREGLIREMQDAGILAALRRGQDVIIDETHLTLRGPLRVALLLWEYNIDVEYEISDFTHVHFNTCSFRDRERIKRGERGVGPVILSRKKNDLDSCRDEGLWTVEDLAFPPIVPYEVREDAPKAFILDMDGTIAKITNRGPFDYSLCYQDEVNESVKAVVCGLAENGNKILVTSGRSYEAMEMTQDWLDTNGVPWNDTFFRLEGDDRRDSIVKLELFNKYLRRSYNIRGAIDDRGRVCRIWHALGIPLFRVGDPSADF